jgi:hypothetical protein
MQTNNIQRRVKYFLPLLGAALIGAQLSASAATLVHRYSFSETDGSTLADSVGGAAWAGTFCSGADTNPVAGTFDGSQLYFSSASSNYVVLPPAILADYPAVTIEAWASFGALPSACFLFGFGGNEYTNVLSGGAASGFNYIMCHPQGGRIAISDAAPGWYDEQGTGGAGNLSSRTVHITAVFDPPAGYLALYTNGVLVSRNNAETIPMSSVSNFVSYIGKSLYDADSFMDFSIDEFRIWNGALSALEVGGTDLNGPDNPSTNYGTLTGIQLQIPYYQLVQGAKESSSVNAQFSLLPNAVDVTANATFTTSKTNILTVDTNGVITAVGQGSAAITAWYGGMSNSQVITVVQPASALIHRYSFSDATDSTTVADSVGGSAWNGTLPNGGTFTGSQLVLASNLAQYVQLPAGIISNYSSLTIEAWATFGTLPNACFFWGFGDTDTSGAGMKYIFCQPKSGAISISHSDPGWNPDQPTSGGGDWSGRTVHVTAVFDPTVGYIALYTNNTLVSANRAVTVQLTEVSSVLNYIGKSLYTGDQPMDVSVDEFRIYSGALTPQGIAISDAAGPDSIPGGVTNGAGALLSLSFQAPSTIVAPHSASLKMLANYATLTNFDLVGNSVFTPAGLTITSSDPSIVYFGSDNRLHALNPGVATIQAVYQGVTNSRTITVVRSSAGPVLTHRYSFGETSGTNVADSVGGTAWNGFLPKGGTLTGSQVSLASGSQQYVQLPAGIISNYTAVSFETWATFPTTLSGNICLFDFGDTDSGGAGMKYIFCQPVAGRVCISTNDAGWQGTGEQNAYSGMNWGLQTNLHIVAVVNPPEGYIAIYTNGLLAGFNETENDPLSGVSCALNYIGRSLYNGDGYFNVSVDEFRIYNGVMSPDEVAATQIIGPNFPLNPTLTATSAGGSITLSWPTNYASTFTLVKSSAAGAGASWSPVGTAPTVAGANYQIAVPQTNAALFFRLRR